ncbi:hypothetical protein C0J52_14109 [Blattella germanica]|nr:hypothetical protein C0J52_14109 [Blattella germanica]
MEEESFIPNLASMLEISLVEDASSTRGVRAVLVAAKDNVEAEQTVTLNEDVVTECDPTEQEVCEPTEEEEEEVYDPTKQEVDMTIEEPGYISDNDLEAEAEDEGEPSPSLNYQQDYEDYGHGEFLNTKYRASSEECDEELNAFSKLGNV